MLRRPLAIAALLAIAFTAACADGPTAPRQECQVTQGSHDCEASSTTTP